jgi:integrase
MITCSNSLCGERDAPSCGRRSTSRHVRFRAVPRTNRTLKTANTHNHSATSSTTEPPSFGTTQVREITTRDIDKFFFKLSVSKKTKKNIFSTLKLILKRGKAWGNVRENVWESAKKIGKSETEVRAYADAEVESILSRSTGVKRLFYWLAVETGMRAGELRGLRVIDVDPFKRLVRVRQAVWRGKVQTPKTKNAIRDIPIPIEIVDALRAYIGTRTSGFVLPRRTVPRGTLAFC